MQRRERSIREFFISHNYFPLPYNFLLHGACGYQDPTKFKRDSVRVEEDKEQDRAATARDSEEDDVDVDEDDPVTYKTVESQKKKWSRLAEESRDNGAASPVPSPVLNASTNAHPSATSAAAAAAAIASDKGEGSIFAMRPLMDRALYEKTLMTNLKPNPFLTKAT